MIDEVFKEKLLGALKTAVDRVNAGADNNSAVIKTADACDFNLEQTSRLCELFNTARTIYHFENTPTEKTAEFALVDKDVVISELFGGKAKSATDTETVHGLPDYSEYYGRELDAFDGKVAEYDEDLFGTPIAATPDVESQAQRINKIVLTQRKLAEHGLNDSGLAFESAKQTVDKLAADLTNDYWLNGNDKYARLVRCYEADVNYSPVFEQIKAAMPSYMACSDDQLKSLGRIVEDRDLGEFKTAVEDTKTALEGASNLKALSLEIQKEATATLDAFNDIISDFVPSVKEGEFDDILSDTVKLGQTQTRTEIPDYSVRQILTGEAPGTAAVTKTNAPASQALSGVLEQGKNVGLSVDDVLGKGESDFNKKLVERLKNQQREVLLQDLLVNDSFISDADPEAVGAIYSQIMQIAPEVSLNKEVVRAIVRQGIHNVNAVSPFDASAWADLEKTIKEVQGTLPKQKMMQGARR